MQNKLCFQSFCLYFRYLAIYQSITSIFLRYLTDTTYTLNINSNKNKISNKMTDEQRETLRNLIETNPAGAVAYLEAIGDNSIDGRDTTLVQASKVIADSKKKENKVVNQLKY